MTYFNLLHVLDRSRTEEAYACVCSCVQQRRDAWIEQCCLHVMSLIKIYRGISWNSMGVKKLSIHHSRFALFGNCRCFCKWTCLQCAAF